MATKVNVTIPMGDNSEMVKPHPTFCSQIKQDITTKQSNEFAEAYIREKIDRHNKAQKFDELKKAYDEFYAGSKTENDLLAVLDRIMQ